MGSNFNLVTRPVKKDNDEEEDIKDEEEIEVEVKKKSNDNAAKKRMIMFMGIIVGFTILLLIILFFASLAKGSSYSYSDIERIMKNAAVSYFKDYPEYLPATEGGVVEVDSSNLVAAGKMKDLSEYTKSGVNCTGSVQVEKSGSEYLYSPILDCGSSYSTTPIAAKVMEQNSVVTEGYGLYDAGNGNYVFRGEIVNNYVQMDNNLWRIVKITSDNNLVLVSEDGAGLSQPWDDRYNEARLYDSGINNFGTSRMKEYLQKIYKNPSEEDREVFLSKNDKSKIISHSICIGKRTTTSVSNDNSIECSDVYENQKYSLLTLSDYMMASIDPNCKNAETKSCKNYNYLVVQSNWWLVTANSENDSTVFMVDRNGIISLNNASNYGTVRPVIYLNSNVKYKSGNGSQEKPYVLR